MRLLQGIEASTQQTRDHYSGPTVIARGTLAFANAQALRNLAPTSGRKKIPAPHRQIDSNCLFIDGFHLLIDNLSGIPINRDAPPHTFLSFDEEVAGQVGGAFSIASRLHNNVHEEIPPSILDAVDKCANERFPGAPCHGDYNARRRRVFEFLIRLIRSRICR